MNRAARVALILSTLLVLGPAARGPLADEERDTPSPANALLKSLILPGWGQLSLGSPRAAGLFFGIEASGIAAVVTALLRSDWIEGDARLMSRAYADLGPSFRLSDNALDVLESYYSRSDHMDALRLEARDIYPDDIERQREYTESYDLGVDWSWQGEENWRRFVDRRRYSRSVYRRAVGFTGILVFNRIVSGLLAARQARARRGAGKAEADIGPFLTLSDLDPRARTLRWGLQWTFR